MLNQLRQLFGSKNPRFVLRALSGPRSQPGGEAVRVAMARSGAYAVSASRTGHLMAWDASNGTALEDQSVAGIEVNCLTIDALGRRVLLGGADGKFQGIAAIADFEKRSIDQVVFGSRPILALDFSPNGAQVATGSLDWVARVVDPETYDAYFGGRHPDCVTGVKFTADGRKLVSVSQDWTLKVWDIRTGAVERSFECEPDNYDVRLSADGAWLVTKHAGSCQLIDTESGLPLAAWEMAGKLLNVSTHPVHGIMVWEGLPAGAQAYSPRRQAVLGALPSQTAPAYDLAVSADGQRLVLSGADGSLSFWTVG